MGSQLAIQPGQVSSHQVSARDHSPFRLRHNPATGKYTYGFVRPANISTVFQSLPSQEVWFRKDYEIIRKATPYMSYFESFNTCSGYFLPIECSGLVILSRHPIESVEFR